MAKKKKDDGADAVMVVAEAVAEDCTRPAADDPFLRMDSGLAEAIDAIKARREAVLHREMGMAMDSLVKALEGARGWAKIAADVNQTQKLGVQL